MCMCVCEFPQLPMLLTRQIVVFALLRYLLPYSYIFCALFALTTRTSLTLTLPHTHPLRRLWSNAEVNLIYCIYAGPTDDALTNRQTEPGKLTALSLCFSPSPLCLYAYKSQLQLERCLCVCVDIFLRFVSDFAN